MFKCLTILPVFLFTVFSSCGRGNTTGSTVGVASMEIPDKNRNSTIELIHSVSPSVRDHFNQGEEIGFTFRTTEIAEPLDSVVLYIDGERIGQITGKEYRCVINPDNPVGRTTYRLTAYKNGKSTVRVGEYTIKSGSAPRLYGYQVVNTYPHDKFAYTQGLYWKDGYLYEGTGQEGESSLRKVELETGKVVFQKDLDPKYFGEGITELDGKIYQLTWRHNIGFIYNAKDFQKTGEFGYGGEGWGLTTDGRWLYLSDGSEKISVIDPSNFQVVRTIQVYDHERAVKMLNELEWIEGEIWANVYLTDQIVRIDPETGVVTGVIDMKGLLPSAEKDMRTDVLNGIAYDPETRRIFVTGKYWSKLFEIVPVARNN